MKPGSDQSLLNRKISLYHEEGCTLSEAVKIHGKILHMKLHVIVNSNFDIINTEKNRQDSY